MAPKGVNSEDMIDPVISLAFAMHSNRGVYALLLGPGVSWSAGIPTGWEVVLDLLRKLAHVMGQDCEPDPSAWYRDNFGEEPDYSKLLDEISKSPTERQQLLRSYFEPNEEEREEGLKVPTAAHIAIAELVANGYIRVIITSNFDRLMEDALKDVGVVPTVISTSDAVEGALPIVHTTCIIIKVHGDYLDTRIKNTPPELEHYDKSMNCLLDRVFDEFGLVVSGWSADWDTALRAAFERCKTHRFTTFWAAMGEPGESAKRLTQLRRAEIVQIKDADAFFQDLTEKVSALEEIARPHPLSAPVATATLKRFLVDDRHRIRLHDLVIGETEKLQSGLNDEYFDFQGLEFSAAELTNRVHRYEALVEILQALIATGCYWGERPNEILWAKSLERLVNPPAEPGGLRV